MTIEALITVGLIQLSKAIKEWERKREKKLTALKKEQEEKIMLDLISTTINKIKHPLEKDGYEQC